LAEGDNPNLGRYSEFAHKNVAARLVSEGK
jgi:hypothetical protein